MPPSGQVNFSAPLSVEYITMVLSAMPSSSSLSSIWPTWRRARPCRRDRCRGRSCPGFRLEARPDVHAGRVPPQEERLAGLLRVLHEADRRASVTSSSTVSMRFLVSGPVLSIFCVPSGFAAQVWITPRVPYFFASPGP